MKLTPTSRKGVSNMGLTRVAVRLRSFSSSAFYQSQFLVDTGATDSLAPASELKKIGIKAIGKMAYELATGTIVEYEFGLAEISFMNETTAGRIIFGPDNVEPLLGVTALESVGVTIDPTNRTLKWLPAIPLK
jgi:clan AA aspartic protease